MVRNLHVTKPLFIFTSIELLYQAAVPLLLIILGIQIAQTNVTKNLWELNYILFIRLLLSPFIAFVIAELLGMNGLLKKVFIIQSAMPIAINSAILAIKFDTRANFVTNAVVISTMFSVITLALIFVFVEMVG
jgi:predicted permease